jgi:transglycosylase-like protein with SLT domain
MIRWAFWVIALAFALWMLAVLWAGPSGGEPTELTSGPVPTDPPPATTDEQVAGLERQLVDERARRRRLTRSLYSVRRYARTLHRTLLHRPDVGEAISLSCVVYGSCSTLWRRARCESTLNPYVRNASGATGLYQFIDSTFRSTPFARFSIYSPYAQALAAGWMNRAGRGSEWSCR